MSYQPINLGTPNNNNGDSLYAGGFKINSNFEDLYLNLGGSSSNNLKINVGTTTPGTGTTLTWSASQQAFIPSSANTIRTLGSVSSHSFFITNNSGVAGGADANFLGPNNTAVLALENRNMLYLRAYKNTSTATTRGAFDLNLGNASVTSLSVYTTSTVIRGSQALEVYRASAEDTATYTQLVGSTSTASGITLFQTPVLNIATLSSGVRTGTDSSNAIAHTGFVKLNLAQYPLSSTTLLGGRGIVGTTNNLSANNLLTIDGVYHPKHVEGLIYNYNTINNQITLVTGAACHWSYNTSGVAGIASTTAIAVVASYNPIIRAFQTGWTPQYKTDGTTAAVIDGSIVANTWYYLYYLGAIIYTSSNAAGASFGSGVGNEFWPGSSNVVVSSNRDITSVDAQLQAAGYGSAWKVVRRLGPVKSNASATGLVPFNVKRIDHGGFEYYWGLQPNGYGTVNGADSSYTITASRYTIRSSSDTFTLATYDSAVLTTIPPIPGITAHITVKHKPTSSLPIIYMYGDSWTVNSSISALFPPFESFRSMSSGLTNIHNINVPMIPDGCYIPDGTYGGAGILSVTTSTGLVLRWIMQTADGYAPTTSQALSFTVTGFRYAR